MIVIRRFLFFLVLLNFSACSSQSLLPFSDVYEINKGKSILSTYTCEDLIEKAEDKSFSLKNLAGLRAMARCKEYKFDFAALSDLEKRLYSGEIESFNNTASQKNTNDLSINDLKKLIKKEKNKDTKFSLHKQLRIKLKRSSNQRKQYLTATANMYEWAKKEFKKTKNDESALIYYQAAQIYARTFWTDDDGKTADKALSEAIKLLGAKRSKAELYFLKGRIFEEEKNVNSAIENYDLTLADIKQHEPKNISFNTDRVLWLKAWIIYKERNFAEAETAFKVLIENTSELSEKSRAQFYLARTLKNLNREEEAKKLLEEISQNDFFGYYGLVSYRELGKKFPALSSLKAQNNIKFDLKLEFMNETEKHIFQDLVKFREFALAERAVLLISKDRDSEINMNLYLAQKAHIYMPLFRTFGRLNNNDKMDLFLNYPNQLFPRPYQDKVEEMADKTKLPTSLIYSIMKQESGFNEKARSPADAMGLMQVIPRLAKQLSRKFEIPFKSEGDLYDPEINIQLGTYELMEQVRKQNGQLTYVAAAYNAGPNALLNWLKNRKRDDVLEFIEEIPYDETRTYVKIIARNKVFYERISNQDREHEFPADFLN